MAAVLAALVRRRRREVRGRRLARPHEQDAARRVVDDEPGMAAEALGPEPLVVAVAREHEQVGAHARGDDLPLDAPVAHLGRRLAPEAVARVGQERAGGGVGDLVPARAARRRRPAPEQPGPPARGHLLELARRDREQRDVGVGGRERGGGLDARLPPRLGYPHDDPHQTTRRANHSASVEASRIGGTVSAPRRTNSPMSVSWSWAWSTRRQSSVASEPT